MGGGSQPVYARVERVAKIWWEDLLKPLVVRLPGTSESQTEELEGRVLSEMKSVRMLHVTMPTAVGPDGIDMTMEMFARVSCLSKELAARVRHELRCQSLDEARGTKWGDEYQRHVDGSVSKIELVPTVSCEPCTACEGEQSEGSICSRCGAVANGDGTYHREVRESVEEFFWLAEAPKYSGVYAVERKPESSVTCTGVWSEAKRFGTREECQAWCDANPYPEFAPVEHGMM